MKSNISRRDFIKYSTIASVGLAAGVLSATSCKDSNNISNKNMKDMKVLLLNGSPREKGCTFTALSEVAASLEKNGVKTEIHWIGSEAIASCRACAYCKNSGRCVMNDGVNSFVKKAEQFDGFVFGSPVHYASASGAITAFLDRVFYSAAKIFSNKPGAAVVSCRRAGSTAALDQLNKYFPINNMPQVPSQYWCMVHGNTPDEVKQDLEGLQIMRTLGINMAWLLKCIDAGKEAGIVPQYETEHQRTNFIR
ncbi:MAG: flavodoxin family protein [Lactococcus lactis]|jgi:multimeric flavodoxin WrbA|nr:flavodoxin family protein [Lactococcus lactis]